MHLGRIAPFCYVIASPGPSPPRDQFVNVNIYACRSDPGCNSGSDSLPGSKIQGIFLDFVFCTDPYDLARRIRYNTVFISQWCWLIDLYQPSLDWWSWVIYR